MEKVKWMYGRFSSVKEIIIALAGMAQWIECRPENQKVAGSIPGQVTWLGFRPHPQLQMYKRQPISKCNKPGSEGQIPYDHTFNWNIINKTKKQTKYNQRH